MNAGPRCARSRAQFEDGLLHRELQRPPLHIDLLLLLIRPRPTCERVEDRRRLVALTAMRQLGGFSEGGVDCAFIAR